MPPSNFTIKLFLLNRVTLLDHLVCYLGKAITVQMKVKGSSATFPASLTMGNSVTPAPPATWFMRGETTKKHAHNVARLLTDMAEVKILFYDLITPFLVHNFGKYTI